MKTGYLITARLKSTRLKRKILLDIDGETVLDKVIKRCKSVIGIDEIILCTSTNPQDSELEDVARKHNIKFFKGDEDDVLDRLLNAAQEEKVDRFLSITADNPLHSIKVANKIISFDNDYSFDFIFTYNLPVGMAPYFIRTEALEVAVKMKQNSETEIWGPFVYQPSFFKIGEFSIAQNGIPSTIRITCDYEEDFLLITELYKKINVEMPDIDDVIETYINNPGIFDINKGIIQRGLDPKIIDSIQKAFRENVTKGLAYAKQRGITINPGLIKKVEVI